MNTKLPRLPYADNKLFEWLFAAVLLVPLAFSLFTYENFETIKYGLLCIFVGAALIAMFVKMRRSGHVALRGGKYFYWFLGLFWLWTLLATIFAWDKNYSFFGFYPRFTSGFLFYSVWASLVILLNALEWEPFEFLLKTSAATSGLVALWGILQSVGIGFYAGLNSDFFNRAAPSFLGNTDFSSMFVVALLPLTVLFLFRSPKLWQKICYSLSGLIQLWSLFIFASRGSLVALFAAFLVAIFLMGRFAKKKSFVWVSVLVLAVVASGALGMWFLNFSRPQNIQSIISLSDANTSNRLGVWKLSLSSIARRPWFGVGLGNFQLMFEHDRRAALITGGFFDDAHNLPLQLAVTGGVFLLLWFLLLILAAAWAAWRRLTLDPKPEDVAVLVALVAWLTASMFTPVAIPCYLMLGVLLSACFRENPLPLAAKPAARSAAVCLGVIFVVWGAVFLTAEILFFRGTQGYSAGDYTKAYKFTTVATYLNPFSHLYYVFRNGSAIMSGQPIPVVDGLMAKLERINSTRSYSYIELANLDYLLLYRTQNSMYIGAVLQNMNKAISLDPYSDSNYFTMASYELIFHNIPAAQAADEAGLALNRNYESPVIFLAKTYQLQNNKPALVTALIRASKINPDDLAILKLLHEMQQAKNIQDVPFNIKLDGGQLD